MGEVTLPPIAWIASYPKSGNTWMRYLVHTYLYGVPNKMSAVGTRSHTLEQYISGPNRREILLGENEELVRSLEARIHTRQESIRQVWPSRVKEYVVMKNHCKHSSGHPLLSSNGRVILIVRNPKDVLLSAVNYFQLLERLQPEDIEYFVKEYIKNEGVQKFRARGYGSWTSHWKSWVEDGAKSSRVLLVTYEDMLNDTSHIFSQVLNFLDIAPDPERIKFSVENSSLDSLRSIEKKSAKDPIDSSKENSNKMMGENSAKRFFNKGEAGRSLEGVLGLKLDEEFDSAFIDPICQLNNALDSGLVRVAASPRKVVLNESTTARIPNSHDLADDEYSAVA